MMFNSIPQRSSDVLFDATLRYKKLLILLAAFMAALTFTVPSLAQQSDLKQLLGEYKNSDEVVVTVYFSDIKVAQKISKTYEPRESKYEQGYLILQEERSEIERLMQLSDSLDIKIVLDQQATTIEHQKKKGIGIRKSPRKIIAPRDRTSAAPQTSALAFVGIPGFACYRTVEETFATAEDIVANNPNIASWTDVGDSWEKVNGFGGYDMNVLRLTNSAIAGPKPTIFITSSIHAREYTPAELMTRFAEYLIANYETDADVSWIIDHTDIRLMLIANPDGRKQAETGLSWRKNTNQNYCGATSNSRGADLNRNFSFEWGCCNGSSGSQCSNTFRGSFAASEPETQAVIGQLSSIFPDARGPNSNDAAPLDTSGIYLDIHSSGRLLLWPWGSTANTAPNGPQLQTLGRKLAFYNGHAPQQSIGLYPTDGTTTSYGYGELGLASYTYELGTQFFESCSYFENTLLPDNIPSLLYALKTVRAPYQLPAGPEGYGLSLSPSSASGVPAGTDVNLSVTFDDTRYNNSNGTEPSQNIAAVEYYIDVPPWQLGAGGSAVSMTASDGSFNSGVENAQAVIDTSSLAEGRHTVYTRAQDSAGNWGVVSAGFIDIDNNATLPTFLFQDNFESNQGWTANPNSNDSATTGQWQRANPEQTSSGGTLQLGTTVSGSFDLVTGPLAGASAGTNDIDSGVTSIRSPDIQLPANGTALSLSFYSYLAHTSNSSVDDFLRISAVGDSSGTVLLFEETGAANQDNASWVQSTASLDALAGQTIYLLIEAADAAGGSLVEAGVDDISISAVIPSGGNLAPNANAGSNQVITLPASASLVGTVSDDGLPIPPGSVSSVWSVVSGSGTVTFSNASAATSNATFSSSGIYVLRLTANDGALTDSDDVQITVNDTAPANTAPTVDAGSNQTITLPAQANLNGTVNDDGLPNPPGSISATWANVSGPGTVSFANANSIDTSASFSAAGVYVLRLTATDSDLSTSDELQITVNAAGDVCPAGSIDFNQFTLESYSNQDLSGGASASADGAELTLTGNAWKRSSLAYNLTPNSRLVFEYASANQGEIHGIGFDADQDLNNNARLFQFWGTQNWTGGGAINYSPKYAGGGAFQSYSIAVGASYAGAGFRMVFVNDKDAGTADNQGVYRCVRVVEDTPVSCAIEENFSSGLGGWVNSAASTCSTGTYISGTPTEVNAGGVTTQPAGDHTSGNGAALFSAVNTSAGANDIDGGECIIESPNYVANNDSDLSIWYFHGQRDANDDAGDFFNLELSLNGGGTWSSIAANGDTQSNAAWTEATATIPAGSTVRLRLSAADGTANGDLIEAGVDDLRICETP